MVAAEPVVDTLGENIGRRDIEHATAKGVVDGKDVSAEQRSWKTYIWDTWDKSPEERRLVTKIDCTLLLFGSLGTLVKYLDRQNINNAFNSGMKEELSFYGNELVHAQSFYTIASCLGLWPMQLLMTRVNPRYFIPSIELGWTIATFCQSQMHTSAQMAGLRVLVGFFESGHFSCMVYLFGAWYQKAELGRRIGILNAFTAIGPMFSGYLQTAAYKGLDGVGGMSGWRWLFIVDGVISLGVLLPQYFILPDVPSRQKKDWIFSETEIELARDRNPIEGRVKQGRFTRAQIKRWFLTPEIWALWIISICNSIGFYPAQSMQYWLKAWGDYSIAEINDYPTAIYAMDLFQMLFFGWTSDTIFKGRRWPGLIIGPGINFLVCVLLAATPVFPKNRTFRFFLYTQTSWGTATSSMFWAWTNEILKGDPATRAFAGGGLNVWASVGSASIPLAVFQTVQQPSVVSGNWTSAGMLAIEIIVVLALVYWTHRKNQRLEKEHGHIAEVNEEESEDNGVVDSKHGESIEESSATSKTPAARELVL